MFDLFKIKKTVVFDVVHSKFRSSAEIRPPRSLEFQEEIN